MSTEKQLTVLNFEQMSAMGKVFAESGMFADAKAAAQAIVKIQAGQEIGVPPFAAMSGIHIIQGKPAIGAGLMASCVKASGKYDYKVVESTDKICSIDFYEGGEKIGNSTFTEAEAKKAQTKNMDKYPKNMLFARAMSNGVKWFTPDVFSGPVYTPEELGDVKTEDIQHEEVKASTKTETVKAKPALADKNVPELVKRLLAGEPGVAEKVKETYTVTKDQAAKLNQAATFHKKKQPLYSLLNSAGLTGDEFNDAKLQIDLCDNNASYTELESALTKKQTP